MNLHKLRCYFFSSLQEMSSYSVPLDGQPLYDNLTPDGFGVVKQPTVDRDEEL